jgi:hypothetical protein
MTSRSFRLHSLRACFGSPFSMRSVHQPARASQRSIVENTLSRTPYTYKSLKPQGRHLRLLTLDPSQHEDSPLVCSVAHHSLDEHRLYEALSYTWGDRDDICSSPIFFNGHSMNISSNLEAALRALRLRNYHRILWIDALCINQQDGSEKSRQVQMMGSIFESAQRVVIWLGNRSKDSDLAMDTMAGLKDISDFEHITEQAWRAIESLFSRPWFSRIWVLQEFKRGRNPVILCGKKSFSWDKIGEAICGLWTTSGYRFDAKHVKLYGEVGKVISMASTRLEMPLDANIEPQEAAQHFQRMLRFFGSSQATVPHDKIYGLLGLSDAFAFANSNPPSIDYSREVTNVYKEWAIFLISIQSKLDLVCVVAPLKTSDSKLPSWTPDWRRSRYNVFESLITFKTAFAYEGRKTEAYDPTPSFSKDGRTLSVKGYALSTIENGWAFTAPDPNFIACRLPFASPQDSILACFLTSCKPKNTHSHCKSTRFISRQR